MIYLIGGAMRCGKSTAARMLAKELGVQWVSTDYLREVIKAMYSPDELLEKFPLSWMMKEAGTLMFEKYTPEYCLQTEITESNLMWPGMRAFIEEAHHNHDDYIIEGIHLFPSLVHELMQMPVSELLRIVYLVKKDKDKIREGIKCNDDPHDWLISYTRTNRALEGAINAIQTEGIYFEKEAKKYGFAVMDTGGDFKKVIGEAVRFLLKG